MLQKLNNYINSVCHTIWQWTVTSEEQQLFNSATNSPPPPLKAWYIAKAMLIRAILPVAIWLFLLLGASAVLFIAFLTLIVEVNK